MVKCEHGKSSYVENYVKHINDVQYLVSKYHSLSPQVAG